MNHSLLSTSLMLSMFCLFLNSCTDRDCREAYVYKRLEPIVMSYEEFRTPIKSEGPKALKHPGKLYIKSGYLFINEINAGIHVIDNRNPSSPQFVSFIPIPGNVDLAAQGNYLYVDSYVDLVTLDISNPEQVEEINRQEDVFQHLMLDNGFWGRPAMDFTGDVAYQSEEGIIVGWEEKEVVEFVDCGDAFIDFIGFSADEGGAFIRQDQPLMNGLPVGGFADGAGIPEFPSGTGGSMARFTLQKQHLYAVTNSDLLVFDIAFPAHPQQVQQLSIGWAIETIFPFQDVLLIGSQTGMYIYSTEDPSSPYRLSLFEHLRSCDPVVAEGQTAYVTLREGSLCPGGRNQLDVLDISDLTNPQLIRSFPMSNPHGLGIKENILFICEGEGGLKVFDAAKLANRENKELPLIKHFKDIHAYDVIPLYNLLLMIGSEGLFQYDYSDLENIELLSVIPVEQE